MDKATLALPARYTFCFAENEERSPWEPRHVELGMDPQTSMLTISAIRGIYVVMESTVSTGIDILRTLVESTKVTAFSNYYQIGTGAQLTLVLCPEHAVEIHASGLSKADVREYVHQNARMPLRDLVNVAHYGNRNWPACIDQTTLDTVVPITLPPDDLGLVVAGVDGRFDGGGADEAIAPCHQHPRLASSLAIRHVSFSESPLISCRCPTMAA